MSEVAKRRRFLLFLIKPSHYDDDGYVIQWLRSALPSNSLACLYGIAQRRHGDAARSATTSISRSSRSTRPTTRVRPDRIVRQIAGGGRPASSALVGVQSNQFPRAMDIARPLAGGRRAGLHRRLPRLRLPRDAAGDAGLAEGGARSRHLAVRRRGGGTVRRRAAATPRPAALKPIYNYLDDLPGLEGAADPILPPERVGRTIGMISSFDAGRGCPFLCSFCTIINVQGRKSRYRSADDIERDRALQSRQRHPLLSSSPTTISRATATGRRSSTG